LINTLTLDTAYKTLYCGYVEFNKHRQEVHPL